MFRYTRFNENWPDVRVGDFFFVLGHSFPSKHEWNEVKKANWYHPLKRSPFDWPQQDLFRAYQKHGLETGREPEWMNTVSPRMKRYLRMSWLQGECFDPLAILPTREGLDFGFAVQDSGLIHDVCIAFNLFRLGQIRQLGLLHDPVMNELAGDAGVGIIFEHTRLMHSYTVAATAALIGSRCGLSPHELRHLQAAAMSHDWRTPAGGDSVKFIDPEAFDEDAHYADAFLNNPEWDRIKEEHDLDEALLTSTVGGQGKLGRILDIADKSAYVAHDLDEYLMGKDPSMIRYFTPPETLIEVWNWKKEHGDILCDLWKYVKLSGEEVVFTNGRKLADFLHLRALLFRHLYYNPKARYREQVLGVLIISPLYRKGLLTKDWLIRASDENLMDYIQATHRGREFSWALGASEVAPHIVSFPDLSAAKEHAYALVKNHPGLLVMWESFPPSSEKAVRYLVEDGAGKVRPFIEAYPKEAEEILALGRDANPAKLYILDRSKLRGILREETLAHLFEDQEYRLRQAAAADR